MASGWDFLAGFATQLGGGLQARQEAKERDRLKKMEEDALMKRQMFLEQYRATVEQAAKEADYERTKNDVTAQFTNPETGEVFGRTKSGETVPLSTTSDEYKRSIIEGKTTEAELKRQSLENARMQPELIRARINEANASAARSSRPTGPKEKPDELPKEIRKAYTDEIARLRADGVDEADLYIQAQTNLLPIYGKEAIQQSLGGRDAAAKQANPAAAPLAQASRSVTQPNAPTVEQILAEANKAVQAGVDPAKVEARMAQLMQQYGYTQ